MDVERREEVTVAPGPRQAHCGCSRRVTTMVCADESKPFTRPAESLVDW
jgi:hypothetical protein